MPDHVEQLLIEYRTKGVIVDTNLLHIVGAQNPDRIDRFSRTDTFTADDFKLLDRLLGYFETAVTTPPILTEVSNLLGQLPKKPRRKCTILFQTLIPKLREMHQIGRASCRERVYCEV